MGDRTKLKSIGPYAAALSVIIGHASQNRDDIKPADFAKSEYFRGTAMSEVQLNQIGQLAKDFKKMCLYGFTSTSRFRNVAETFAYEDPEAGL